MPAWMVFHDEKEVVVAPVQKELEVEIGVLDISRIE